MRIQGGHVYHLLKRHHLTCLPTWQNHPVGFGVSQGNLRLRRGTAGPTRHLKYHPFLADLAVGLGHLQLHRSDLNSSIFVFIFFIVGCNILHGWIKR